jgi:transposase-like protein
MGGHVNTIEEEVLPGRRRRRRYSAEFKAQVVAACRRPGVSLAAIALNHKLNANLLRRWVEQAEGKRPALVTGDGVTEPSATAPAFVSLALETKHVQPTAIRIDVRRADQSITITWPASEAAQCAAWLREWLA